MDTPGPSLILSPHADDETIGCGGLIYRRVHEGHPVHVVAFSSADASLPDGYGPGTTRREMVRACQTLGVPQTQTRCLDYPVRRFPECRQDILEQMRFLAQELQPRVVVVPAECDCHQDHQVIRQEAVRAFQHCSMVAFEPPKNGIAQVFHGQFYVRMTAREMDCKLKALGCYASQLAKNPEVLDMVQHLGWCRGFQVGSDYAEAYEVIRWIV